MYNKINNSWYNSNFYIFQFVVLALCVAAAAASGYGGAQSHQSVQM